MILWTIQCEAAVRNMRSTGALRGDGRRICLPFHRPAYRWMIRQMRGRLGSPPPGSRYPVWAWKVCDAAHPKPDLRSTAHLPRGTRGARIEFEVPDDRVLLSDFGSWHIVLAGQYLADDAQDYAAEEARARADQSEQDRLARIEQSWTRIFELERGDPDWHGPIAERSIQATFWSISLDDVRSMTWFTAR